MPEAFLGAARARSLVALATQRPAFAVEPPSLTRHVIFRLGESEHPHLTPEKEEKDKPFYAEHDFLSDSQTIRWRNLLLKVNRFVGAAHRAFQSDAQPSILFTIRRDDDEDPSALPRDFKAEVLPDDVGRMTANESLFCVICPGNDHRPRIRLRVDLHLETMSLTYLADHFPPGVISKALAVGKQDDVETLYGKFWDTADHGPWQQLRSLEQGSYPGSEKDLWGSQPAPSSDLSLGVPFAEFRGVIVKAGDQKLDSFGDEPILFDEKSLLGRKAPAQQAPGLKPRIQQYLATHQPLIRRIVTTSVGPGSEGGGTPYNALTEAVVCGMLDGHALYASPLARDAQIVRYFVAYGGASQSQLGRFVRRIHTMGELRLYALMDLGGEGSSGIRRAGQATRRLAKLVDDAMQSEAPLTARQVAQFSAEHSRISRRVTGGLIYRTERAHHYAQTFKERLKDFRIVRIEGWQPYDAFVRRYLFQEYDLIAGVGRRFQALGTRIDRLMFLHQSQHAETYQSKLGTLVTSLEGQTAQLAKQTSNSSDSLRKIKNLQDRAEDIAILAGIYYGSQAIDHAHLFPEPWDEAFLRIAAILAIVIVFDTLFLERKPLRRLLLATIRWVRFDPLERLRALQNRIRRLLGLPPTPPAAPGPPRTEPSAPAAAPSPTGSSAGPR